MLFFQNNKMEEHCETPKFNEMLGVLKSKINENGVSKVRKTLYFL